MAMKKGPTKGSGGKHRNALRGKGPTPKAEDRVYHKAYKEKQVTNRRKMADPRLAARRRAAKFSSESDDLVIGRNAVLEALRCGVPASTLYVAARIEHDDRTREIIRLAGIHGLNLMEADRLEMDRIARSSNHQGVVMKAQPFQYSSLAELVERADKKSRAMEAANSASARIAARPLFIALDGVTDPQNLGAVIRSAAAFGANGTVVWTFATQIYFPRHVSQLSSTRRSVLSMSVTAMFTPIILQVCMPLFLTFLFGFYCITLPGGFQPGGEKRTFFAVLPCSMCILL